MGNSVSDIVHDLLLEHRFAMIADSGIEDRRIDPESEEAAIRRVADEISDALRSRVSSTRLMEVAYAAWIDGERRKTNDGHDRPEESQSFGRNAFQAGAMMSMTGAFAPRAHPVAAHALRLHGADPDHIQDAALRNGLSFEYDVADSAMPKIKTTGSHTIVSWESRDVVFEEMLGTDDGSKDGQDVRTVRIRITLPDTVLVGLPGHRLDQVVDLPGGADQIIAGAEGRDGMTILTLRPIEDAGRDSD